jgi:hypothetical protein
MKTELKNRIEDFLSELSTEVDVLNYVDIDNIDMSNPFDSICEMIEDNNGFDNEIIYYSNAMDYLMKNDPSLQESLNLAHELGYTADSLDSEILASLLITENIRNEFFQLEDEINEFFEELEEEEEEE